MKSNLSSALTSNLINNMPLSINTIPLLGDGKGGSSIITMGNAITSWLIDDVVATEAGATNLCLYSRDLGNSIWGLVAGANGGNTTKTTYGTVKSADGTRDITLYNANDNLWRYNTTTGLSLPANSVGKEYVLSFLYCANADQLCVASVDNGTTKVELCFKKQWQRAVIRTGYKASSGSVSIRWDFRRVSTGLVKLTQAGFAFAIDDIQVEEVTVGSAPTSYIPTTNATATRGAGQVVSGQSFFVSNANQGKKITAISSVGKKDITYTKESYIICLGQSNNFYGNTYDNYIHLVSPRIMAIARRVLDSTQVSVTGQQIPYKDPSQWNEVLSSGVNSPLGFAYDDMSYAGRLGDLLCDRLELQKLTVFTEAQGGSSFTGNHWTVTTGTLYTAMMARINTFLATNTTAECKGIFVSLMEGDIAGNMSWSSFKTNYINMINGIRAVVGSNVPVVHFGVCDDWSYASGALSLEYMAGFRGMNNGIFGLAKSRFLDTAYVFNGGINYPSNSDIGIGSPLDATHFNANTHYNLIAPNLLQQYLLT